MTKKIITINGKEYEIKKLALGRYAKLLGAFKNLPPEVAQTLASIDTKSTDDFLNKLPGLISDSWENILECVSIASGIKKEVLSEEFDLVDGVTVVKTIFEINDFSTVKKTLVAMFKSKQEPQKTKK